MRITRQRMSALACRYIRNQDDRLALRGPLGSLHTGSGIAGSAAKGYPLATFQCAVDGTSSMDLRCMLLGSRLDAWPHRKSITNRRQGYVRFQIPLMDSAPSAGRMRLPILLVVHLQLVRPHGVLALLRTARGTRS